MLATYSSDTTTPILRLEHKGSTVDAVGSNSAQAEGDEKWLHLSQTCKQLFSTCWMDEVTLFNSFSQHLGEKTHTHSPACLELMIPVYVSKHNSRYFIQLRWLQQHSLSSAPQTWQARFSCTSPLGTFPFTLKLAAFHPSYFKLNVTPLEGPLLTLPSKGNVALILPLVFPITHLFPS